MSPLYTIIFSLFLGIPEKPLDKEPEELALQFFADSLLTKPLFTIDQEEVDDESVIYLEPLVPKKIYKNGFLNGFKLYTEGLAYGFPEGSIPHPMTNEEYKEYGYSKSEIKRVTRIIKTSIEKYSDPIFTDTIKVKVPFPIQEINLEENKDLILLDHSIYIRVYKALETKKEYLVQLTLYEKYTDFMDNAGGFILEFIIKKKDGTIEWALGGSYY